MRVNVILALAAAAGGAAVYQASEWWERAYATYVASEISPDGCFRIDTYKPFWVLPSILHRSPDPDPAIRNSLGRPWDMAVFRRAYEISTGELLGETVVFDPVGPADRNYWNNSRTPGRRTVYANEFLLFDSDRCSDDATLAKLEAFYEQQREANRTIVNAWEEKQRAGPSSWSLTASRSAKRPSTRRRAAPSGALPADDPAPSLADRAPLSQEP